jgi:outer membrane protein assembly factor BamE
MTQSLHLGQGPSARSGTTQRIPRSRMLAHAALAIAAGLLVSACSSSDTRRSGLLQAHRYDLPQGNYVTQTMLQRVQVGMSRLQVRQALGSPLLTDVFLPNRWNYVFSFKHPNGRVDLRRVIVMFDNNERVSEIESDTLPETEDPSDPALPKFNPEALKRDT